MPNNNPNFELKDTPPSSSTTPAIDFSMLLFSLSSSTLISLGEMENPVTKKKEINLDLAKQNIDILSMLKDKTKGNLSSDEDKFLDTILYDLRLKYVEASSK